MALIALEGLGFGYCGREALFRDVSLTLDAGERVAVLGENGVGKTTLLHVIMGLRVARSGRVCGFGESYQSEDDFMRLRQRVGYVFQDPDDQLFCPTVIEDLCFGPLNLGHSHEQALQQAEDILARLEIAHLRDRVSHQLSGGQKRLVTLASVLVMQPEVLLLDEPSNALDRGSRERLIETLLALPQAMILVSHDDDLVDRLATRRVRLASDGLHEAM